MYGKKLTIFSLIRILVQKLVSPPLISYCYAITVKEGMEVLAEGLGLGIVLVYSGVWSFVDTYVTVKEHIFA